MSGHAYTLRAYQNRALNLVRLAIKNGFKSILLQGSTGMGKSVIFAEIIRSAHAKGNSVLFLVHRKKILNQVEKYMERMGIPYGIIQGGRVADETQPIQLGMVQSAHKRLELAALYAPQPADIIIIDEAHRAGSKTYREVIKQLQKNILIGLTATPIRKNGMGLGFNLFEKLIQGKDYSATITDLTNLQPEPALVPIRYFAPVEVDLTGVKVTGGDYNAKLLDARMMNKKILKDIVPNWFKFGDNRKTFVFGCSVAHCVAIRDEFIKAGITAEYVCGDTLVDEQAAILERFEFGVTQVVVSCDIYIEGVDIPMIGTVMICRPTKSLTYVLQMLGRGMRPYPGKFDMRLIDMAGVVANHGFAHEHNDWTLDSSVKASSKANDARLAKNAKPISCPVCTSLYTGQFKCPYCGNIPQKKQFPKEVESIDGVLGEICYATKKGKVKEVTTAEKRDWYAQILNYANAKGKDNKWVLAQFQGKFKCWPSGMNGVAPKETGKEVAGWLHSRRIAFAKGRQVQSRP